MIVSGYSLNLYCDAPGCPRGQAHGMGEYTGETGARCRADARRDGWQLHLDGTCLCRKHADKAAGRRESPDGTRGEKR